MGRKGVFVPNLMQELFPGRSMPELTAEEKRQYHREYSKRGAARRRELYHQNREAILARTRVSKANATPEQKAKRREYERQWKERNKHMLPYYYRRYRLKVEFGLTMERFAEMMRAQGGKCALCHRTDGGRKKWGTLVVDHCHATGRVRALLCHQCNMVLGHANDDPSLLRRMADYVEAHGESR